MFAFHNGRFVQEDETRIHFDDRGLTFGDGIFEVLRTINGRLLFFTEHFERLLASAAFFGLQMSYDEEQVRTTARELIDRNRVTDGELYLELTRGVDATRRHRYPRAGTPPTFFMLAFPLRPLDSGNWERGAAVYTYPDLRHGLCEHKTLNLLPNILAKNAAYEKGGYEALLHREDAEGRYVTEGGSSSYFCVRDGQLFTPAVRNILASITRQKVIDLAREMGHTVAESRVGLEFLLGAQEVFLVSTVSKVMPVRSVDETSFPAPGEMTRRLMAAYEGVFVAGFEPI